MIDLSDFKISKLSVINIKSDLARCFNIGFRMEKLSDRPLISFMLIAYNQESFIREAIKGAFSQTYSPLEILISDDCSTDNTFLIIKELAEAYRGPHLVILNRNEHNLGIGAHINRVMELTKGKYIVGAAGDDVSIPCRVDKIYKAFASSEVTTKSVFSNFLVMDMHGRHQGLGCKTQPQNDDYDPGKLVYRDFILFGCSHAWSREVFDVFGSMITPLTCEDMVIPFRSALLGQIIYIHEPLVIYRQHGTSIWNYKWHDKARIDINREIEFSRFWLYERKAIFTNWIKDLRVMERVSNSNKLYFECLQTRVNARLSEIEEQIFMLNAKFIDRARVIVKRLFRKGARMRIFRHEIGFFLFPNLHRFYRILKNRTIK